jgi:hypothetical protein
VGVFGICSSTSECSFLSASQIIVSSVKQCNASRIIIISFKIIKMFERDSRSLAAGSAGVVLISLLTLPSLFGIVSHFRSSRPKPTTYEDKDGVATDKSIANYSAKIPKVLLTSFNVLGFLTAVALAILGTLDSRMAMFLENWLNVAQWVGFT